MQQYWRDFLLHHARKSNRGAIRPGKGIEAAWANSLLPINNGTYLTTPVTDAEDLKQRCREAEKDAAQNGLPWLFYLYEPLLPEALLPQSDALLEEEGLKHFLSVQVMTADTRALLPPARPLPTVQFKRATNTEIQQIVLNINCAAYGMPLELASSAMECSVYFTNPAVEFSYVAFVDDQPVSTASILKLGDTLYVDLVATDANHRQKGFAEAVMRHALEQAAQATGLHKTALDASQMGEPLYEQMGYRKEPAKWRAYTAH